MLPTTHTEQPSYAFLARTAIFFHALWTALLFVGGAVVFFFPGYAWYQISIMSFTVLIWFPFGMKCLLTTWTRYFEKRAGIYDGDERTFMTKNVSKLFGRDVKSAYVSTAVALFYIASYFASIGALAGWWR
jgi:uncharacterized protein DUF2784